MYMYMYILECYARRQQHCADMPEGEYDNDIEANTCPNDTALGKRSSLLYMYIHVYTCTCISALPVICGLCNIILKGKIAMWKKCTLVTYMYSPPDTCTCT